MNLQDWLEKSRPHQYISRTPKKHGKGYDYKYADQQELPLTPRARPTAPTAEAAKPKVPAEKPAEVKPEVKEAPPPKAEKVTKQAPVQEAKEKAPTKEENKKQYDLATQVLNLAIEKQDHTATVKACRALIELAKRPGNKGMVMAELRAQAKSAQAVAKKMMGRYQKDYSRDKPVQGREKWTYDHVLAARKLRDTIDKAKSIVSAHKPGKQAKAAQKAVEEKAEYVSPGKGEFTAQIPGTKYSVQVDKHPHRTSNAKHLEPKRATIVDDKGKKIGHLDFTWQTSGVDMDGKKVTGDFADGSVGWSGDIPPKLYDSVGALVKDGMKGNKDEPKEKAYHKEPNFRDFGRQAFKFDIPGTELTAHVDQDPRQASLGRYEVLRLTAKNKKGEEIGHVVYVVEAGIVRDDNTRTEGDVPEQAVPLLTKHFKQGLEQRLKANQAKGKELKGAKGAKVFDDLTQDQQQILSEAGGGPAGKVQSYSSASDALAQAGLIQEDSGQITDKGRELLATKVKKFKETQEEVSGKHPTNTITYTEKVVDHAKLARQGGGGFGGSKKIPTKNVQGSRQISLGDDHYSSPEKFVEATRGWSAGAHKAAAEKYREIAASHDDEAMATRYRHAANAHKDMAKWSREREKYPGTEAARRPGMALHHIDLLGKVKKSMEVGDWLQKSDDAIKACGKTHKSGDLSGWIEKAEMADDGKPGKSLKETSTDELKATLAALKPTDPGAEARITAIKAELASRGGKDMEKGLPSEGTNLTPEKARQMLHEGSGGHGRAITEQQRKFFGALGGHLPAPGSKAKKSLGDDSSEDRLEKQNIEQMGKSMTMEDWIQKAMPTHEPRMGGAKSDTQGGSQDGGDWEGVGKTPDNNGGPVTAKGLDAQGNVTGSDPGKQEKLSEDDEEQGEIGKPDKKKPIETIGKSELYPAPLTPARQRDMVAHDIAKLRKSPEMITIGPVNHPYGYNQTMGADIDALSKAEGSTDIPSMSFHPGQSVAQSQVLCKSIRANGCDARHSAMLTACPECGAGATQHRIWPNSSEVQVIPVAGPGGLRPAKRPPMIKIQ